MENDKLINDLLRMSEMNSMSLWKRDVCKRAADALSIHAVDAVEVVRCGECKYMTADGRCLEFADDNIRPSASDFCSYGERREDGET